MLVCVHCVIIGYWQSWFASTTMTISPTESQEARPNAHNKKMTNALRPSTHEHNMHVHDMQSLCPLHLLLNAHWAKLGGLTICIHTLCQHKPPIQTCTQTCGWNVSTNMNAAHHYTNDELVSPRQTLIYVMCPWDHDIWSLLFTTPSEPCQKMLM